MLKLHRGERIHFSELIPAIPGSPLEREWETYRKEVGRLLAEGHEGKHILIKGDEILGMWATHEEALGEGYRRFLLVREPFFVRQILTFEPMIRAA